MIEVTDGEFEKIISEVMDELPQEHIAGLDNVAIVYADVPTDEQREKLQLRCDETLFGLYEGIPLTRRTGNYSLVLPDKITLFKLPLLQASSDMHEFRVQVKHTLWHEIAHYYGLDHDQIHKLEQKRR